MGKNSLKFINRDMKIRIDFVTNSSSSSFILARKGEFTEEQKNAVMDYIIDQMLGEKILSSEDVKTEAAMEEKISELSEDNYWIERKQAEIKKALMAGKDIYLGSISHEFADHYYCKLFKDIWEILEKTGQGKQNNQKEQDNTMENTRQSNFEAIQDDLRY